MNYALPCWKHYPHRKGLSDLWGFSVIQPPAHGWHTQHWSMVHLVNFSGRAASPLFGPLLPATVLPVLGQRLGSCSMAVRPNSAFKPKLHRYASHMAERACHVPGYALQFGLT